MRGISQRMGQIFCTLALVCVLLVLAQFAFAGPVTGAIPVGPPGGASPPAAAVGSINDATRTNTLQTSTMAPWQTGWMATGALSRVPVFAAEANAPAAPELVSVTAAVNWHGDEVAVPEWLAPPDGVSYALYRSDDGENWEEVAGRITTSTGGADIPRVQDPLAGRLALYRLTAWRGGVESAPGPIRMASTRQLAAVDGPTSAVGTSSLQLQCPLSLFLEFTPRPGLSAGVYNLVQVGGGYALVELQVRGDGEYSIYCIALVNGSYRTFGESQWHSGRSAYLVVLDGPRSHLVVDGVDDAGSHVTGARGDFTSFSESGPVQMENCGDIGVFRVLPYVPTPAETGVLFAYASCRSGTAYHVGERAFVPGTEHVITARLRADTVAPTDFGPAEHEIHVTADGSAAGDGSLARPLDLATALTDSKIGPGTTIWLHGGVYRAALRPPVTSTMTGTPGSYGGYEVSLSGAPGRYIRVRPWPGDQVTIDGGMWVHDSRYVSIEGLYFTVSEPRLPASEAGATIGRPSGSLELYSGEGLRVIHCVFADTCQGLEDWTGNVDDEVYGCVFAENGWDDPVLGPRGHAAYVQNTTGTKTYARNISVRPYGLAFHCYGHGNITGMVVQDNVFAGENALLGSQSGGDTGNVFSGNLLYDCPAELGYQGTNGTLTAAGNLSTGPRAGIDASHYSHVVGGVGTVDPDHSGDAVLLADAYDGSRWNLAVWGYGGGPGEVVRLDLSAVLHLGDRYCIRRAAGYTSEPPVTGIYRGPISLALGGVHAAGGGSGVGQEPPSSHFDAFVLTRTG